MNPWRPIAYAVLAACLVLPAHAQTPAVQAEGQTSSLPCNGSAATIAGSRNTITFTGSCAGLQIRGETNTVTVSLAPRALIDIEGNGNRIRFSSPANPRLRVSGSFTTVTPEPGSAAPFADSASLSGNNLDVALDCAGKSLTLQGTRSHFRLTGACTALTVRGEANAVLADLAPSAQVLVEGNGITLTYTVQGDESANEPGCRVLVLAQ